MKTKTKSLTAALLGLVLLLGAVFAAPINVDEFRVEKTNTNYNVLVGLENANLTSGEYTNVDFYIPKFGTSKDMGALKVSDEKTLTYSLRDITDTPELFKKGETYEVVVSTNNDNESLTFMYGEKKSDEGLGLALDSVEVNGEDVTDMTKLSVDNGEEVTVEVRFEATENFDDARLRALVEGYEHSSIQESTDVFSVQEGVTYTKEMTFSLPEDMDSEKDYRLRIIGANDLSGLTYEEYTLYVNTDRDRVDVLDFITTPSSGIESGQNIIANVRMENRGQQDQESVKVTANIPELGVTESSYVSTLEKDDSITSDDLLLYIPEDAEAGEYDVNVSLTYDDGHTTSSEMYSLNVLPSSGEAKKPLVVSYNQDIEFMAGESRTFDVVVANPNDNSEAISVAGANNAWADVSVSPTLRMIESGSDGTYSITVTPKSEVSGEKTLNLQVKKEDKVMKDISVNTYVEDDGQVNWLNIALAVLLVIAIIILLSLLASVVKKGGKSQEKENSEEEEYY